MLRGRLAVVVWDDLPLHENAPFQHGKWDSYALQVSMLQGELACHKSALELHRTVQPQLAQAASCGGACMGRVRVGCLRLRGSGSHMQTALYGVAQ